VCIEYDWSWQKELNKYLIDQNMFVYAEVEFVKFGSRRLSRSFGATIADRNLELAPERTLDLLFLILAKGSLSRGAQKAYLLGLTCSGLLIRNCQLFYERPEGPPFAQPGVRILSPLYIPRVIPVYLSLHK
jgi:hypothetical protein